MDGIMRLFGRSPFGPTQNHMELVQRCVHLLDPLTDAVCAGDKERIAELCQQVSDRESEADRAKHAIRDHLPKALFLPIDRRDLLEIVHMQDSIADSFEEACHLLTLKPLSLPHALHEDFRRLTTEVRQTCERAGEVVEHLDGLVAVSFSGREAERVLGMIEQIDMPETKSEELVRAAARSLFASEDEVGALDAMLWYEVLSSIGQIANFAERAVSRLRLLIAKA
jgi:predicted phosphate transport protein (TIGR00153 family)